MHPVITMNLNGMAYLFDQPAFDALRAYLEQAQRQLQDHPDHADILSDFEQAIAEKCAAYLRPHKTIVTAAEVDEILQVMGPVETEAASATSPDFGKANLPLDNTLPPKRLYRVYEGAVISGICNGMAAYFGLDVTLVRVLFVVLTFLSSGFGVLTYLVLILVIPSAKTAQERAAARGTRFDAQALITRAKSYYAGLQQQSPWRQRWAREQRRWRDRWSRGRAGYAPAWAAGSSIVAAPRATGWHWRTVLGIGFVAVFNTALAIGTLTLMWLLARGATWIHPAYPPAMQLVAAGAAVAVLYGVIAWPLDQFRRGIINALETSAAWWAGVLEVLLRLALLAGAALFAYSTLPDLRQWVDGIPWNWTFTIGGPRS